MSKSKKHKNPAFDIDLADLIPMIASTAFTASLGAVMEKSLRGKPLTMRESKAVAHIIKAEELLMRDAEETRKSQTPK